MTIYQIQFYNFFQQNTKFYNLSIPNTFNKALDLTRTILSNTSNT